MPLVEVADGAATAGRPAALDAADPDVLGFAERLDIRAVNPLVTDEMPGVAVRPVAECGEHAQFLEARVPRWKRQTHLSTTPSAAEDAEPVFCRPGAQP